LKRKKGRAKKEKAKSVIMVKAKFIGKKPYKTELIWFFQNEETKKWLIQEGINHNTQNIFPYGNEFINDENELDKIMKEYENKGYKIDRNF
jgi:hypothetical protein